jgi:hypothetical protein
MNGSKLKANSMDPVLFIAKGGMVWENDAEPMRRVK